jgi:ribosome biogenesis GTPase
MNDTTRYDMQRQAEQLDAWGWDARRQEELMALAEEDASDAPILCSGRVIRPERGLWTLAVAGGERQARLSGRALQRGEEPVVGDWVCWRDHGDAALIEHVLERRTEISRRASGRTSRQQVMAANVDTLFLVQGLGPGRGFTTRGLERYLAMAWDSGCQPVVVLNKADLAADPEGERLDAEAVSGGAEVLLCTACGDAATDLEELRAALAPGCTAAFVGPSGVGKSSLINALADAEVAATGAVREADRRGRHTTTQRQLHRLPDGALLLDTPGLRELALWGDEDAADAVFPEIEALLGQCRYRDCQHDSEPGCAIREALESGQIEAERFDSWLELREELARLATRRDQRSRRETEGKALEIAKAVRRMKKGQAVW